MDLSESFSADSAPLMLAVLVFLAAAVLAFGVMLAIRARGAVKRRAAGIADWTNGGQPQEPTSLRQASLKAAQRLLDYTTRHYGSAQEGQTKVLRQRLIRAGILDPRAVGFFFVGRVVLALALAIAAFGAVPILMNVGSSMLWLFVIIAGVLGYIGPSFYLDRRIKARRDEHRSGFPDFMDLLVVCADSGLSMEASLERVGRELGDSYPSLCANIHITNLEIRAGRTMTDALDRLADRLGLDEARSFATLIQQSAELGSSITDALRVYSDDMLTRSGQLLETPGNSRLPHNGVKYLAFSFPLASTVFCRHYLPLLSQCLPEAPNARQFDDGVHRQGEANSRLGPGYLLGHHHAFVRLGGHGQGRQILRRAISYSWPQSAHEDQARAERDRGTTAGKGAAWRGR
jgi:tight adherence protein C